MAGDIYVPPKPGIVRPADRHLFSGRYLPASREERQSALADLVRHGRITPEEARRAIVYCVRRQAALPGLHALPMIGAVSLPPPDPDPGPFLFTRTFPASGTFTVPSGVTSLKLEAWGAGGGTADSNALAAGGGAYARKNSLSVEAGQEYSITVGTSALDTDGGDSKVSRAGTDHVLAKGGKSGNNGRAGGAAESCIGDVAFSGGAGETGGSNNCGGSGAGDEAAGNDGSGASVAGGETNGGASSTETTRTNAGIPGGAAGGSLFGSGGAGARGEVRITWSESVASGYPVVKARAWGRDAGNTTSHSIPLPSGIQQHDLLLILYTMDGDNDGGTDHTIEGWNRLIIGSNGTTVTAAVFYRFATGAEGSSATAVTTNSEEGAFISLRIANGGIPLAAGANGSSSNANPPSLNTGASKKYLWLATGHWDHSSPVDVSAAPTNYIYGQSQTPWSTTAGVRTVESYRLLETQTQDPSSFTSPSEQWVAFTIAVPERVGGEEI